MEGLRHAGHHIQPGAGKGRKLIVDQGGCLLCGFPQWNGQPVTHRSDVGTYIGGLWLSRMLHGDDSPFEPILHMFDACVPLLERRSYKPQLCT
jgi:hypothetical protein